MPAEVTVTPAAGSPQKPSTTPAPVAPKAPVKPTPAAAPSEVPAPAADASAKEIAEYKRLVAAERDARAKKEREYITERRKWETERKGLGEKLTEYEKLKRERAEAKLNKQAFLKSIYGDNWYDEIVDARVNGGAPTADAVALELSRLEEKFEQKLKDKDEEFTRRRQEAEAKESQATLRSLYARGTALAKAATETHPLLAGEPDPGALILQFMKAQFNEEEHEARNRDWGPAIQKAADAAEEALFARAERAAEAPKYAPKLRERLTPSKNGGSVPPSSPQQQAQSQQTQGQQQPERRTLSQAMTGSTPSGERPRFRTDEERRQAAVAAFNQNRRPPTT